VLELALREGLQLGHTYVGTEHLLLGLIREGEGMAAQVLVDLGAELSRVRVAVTQLLSGYEPGPSGGRATGDGPWGPAPPIDGPRCPTCRSTLDGHVAYRVLPVPAVYPRGDVPPEAPALRVAVVYCLRCGVVIAYTLFDHDADPLAADPGGA